MARPLRIEFPGALYYVTTRGVRGIDIYADDDDRWTFLDVLSEVIERFNWRCHGYCLMDDHYHLLIETLDANLSRGMRQLNGVYTQAINRRHGQAGHLFQGRFKAILVDGDNFLQPLGRHLALNPVRVGKVASPEQWPWSSYCALIGTTPAPPWLTVDAILDHYPRPRLAARAAYRRFVLDSEAAPSPWFALRQQIYLGDDDFIRAMQAQVDLSATRQLANVPSAQRRAPADSLAAIAGRHQQRNAAIIEAYATGAYSYQDIASHFDLHFGTVGRIVRDAKQWRNS